MSVPDGHLCSEALQNTLHCVPNLSSCSRVRKRLWADEVDEAFVDGDQSEDEALLGNDQLE